MKDFPVEIKPPLPHEVPPTFEPSALPVWEEIKPIDVWVPKRVGERVRGQFVQLARLDGTYGLYPTFVVRQPDGKLVRLRGTHLCELFSSENIREGDNLMVVYTGWTLTDANYKKRTYRLFRRKPDDPDHAPGDTDHRGFGDRDASGADAGAESGGPDAGT